MSDVPEEEPAPAAVRDYSLLAMGALLVLTVALIQMDYGVWAMLPVVPGLFALLVHWVLGPPVVLLLLTFLLVAGRRFRGAPPGFAPMPQVEDLAIAAAVIVFIAAHLRLVSLTKSALPEDRRRGTRVRARRARGRWLLESGPVKRSPERVATGELVLLLGFAALFALAGYLLAIRLQLETVPPEINLPDNRIWRAMLLVWSLALFLAGTKILSSILGWQLAGGDESATYLQDQLWAATRGEQRRIQRWAMRGRLQREKREGG